MTTLEDIRKAIREGRAYLETAWGRRKVTSYDHSTGWAVTNNGTDYFQQRSFMVCLSDILIDE